METRADEKGGVIGGLDENKEERAREMQNEKREDGEKRERDGEILYSF